MFYDFIYLSIIGYIVSFIYSTLTNRCFQKRLKGPYSPKYGLMGIFVLGLLEMTNKSIISILLIGFIVPEVVEYLLTLISTRLIRKEKTKVSLSLSKMFLYCFLTFLIYLIYLPLKEIISVTLTKTALNIITLTLYILLVIDTIYYLKKNVYKN